MFGNILKELRIKNGVTQDEIANYLSIKRQTYSAYERNKSLPDLNSIIALSKFYKVDANYLLGLQDSNIQPLQEQLHSGKRIKVLGRVPAGIPIEAIEDVVDEIEISERLANSGFDFFALLVTGDSMYPEYKDGDIVIVKVQPTAETGNDVVAYVGDYNATLKRLIKSDKGLTLRALNPEYDTNFYSIEDIVNLPVQIAGVVVEQRRRR